MILQPYKFVVQAIVQEVDDDGAVTGELEASPVTVFGCEALSAWAAQFPDALASHDGEPSRLADSR